MGIDALTHSICKRELLFALGYAHPRRMGMSRNDLIELAGTLQAMRVYVLEQGARYKPAADVLIELHRGAQWRDWELRAWGWRSWARCLHRGDIATRGAR